MQPGCGSNLTCQQVGPDSQLALLQLSSEGASPTVQAASVSLPALSQLGPAVPTSPPRVGVDTEATLAAWSVGALLTAYEPEHTQPRGRFELPEHVSRWYFAIGSWRRYCHGNGVGAARFFEALCYRYA